MSIRAEAIRRLRTLHAKMIQGQDTGGDGMPHDKFTLATRLLEPALAELQLAEEQETIPRTSDLTYLQSEAFACARRVGFYPVAPDPEDPLAHGAMFRGISALHSEVAEIHDDYRRAADLSEMRTTRIEGFPRAMSFPDQLARAQMGHKPVGLPSEAADVIIGVCEMTAWLSIDLAHAVALKIAHYATREPFNGKKR